MFSAFHYNANRGDKRFKQMYKSGEKRPEPWNRDLTFEDSISRARNNRHLLVEKFRQIQSQLTEEENEDGPLQTTKSQEDEDSSQDAFTSTKDKFLSSKDIYSSAKESPSFKEFNFPSSSRSLSTTTATPISTGQSSSSRPKARGSVSAFDSSSCEGFDYSSSFKNTLGDNFTFHMENYNCSTENIFDKNYNIDNATRERVREVWNVQKNDYNWNWNDDELLLCPGCNQNYMKLKDASLICHNCTLQIDLSSSSISIKMIKEKLKQKLDLHKEKCKERIKYKFKDEKLFIGCKVCNQEFYIS